MKYWIFFLQFLLYHRLNFLPFGAVEKVPEISEVLCSSFIANPVCVYSTNLNLLLFQKRFICGTQVFSCVVSLCICHKCYLWNVSKILTQFNFFLNLSIWTFICSEFPFWILVQILWWKMILPECKRWKPEIKLFNKLKFWFLRRLIVLLIAKKEKIRVNYAKWWNISFEVIIAIRKSFLNGRVCYRAYI